MRQNIWLIMVILIIFGLTLVGCQEATPTSEPSPEQTLKHTATFQISPENEQKPVETEEKPTPQNQASPSPAQAYPPPLIVQPVYNPYPGPSEGVNNFIDWSQAEAIIMTGEVLEIYQAYNLHVTLVLIDGNIYLTIEPGFDDAFNVVERCGEPCKDVIKVSE